jgi:hypothetical protein
MDQIILWKPLYYTSIVIYVIAILMIIKGSIMGVITLFFLIALWSRIPCMISTITKDLEVVDFFTVFLALQIGGVYGGLFALSVMLVSKIFGPEEWFPYTLKDGVSMLIAGIITPGVYFITGHNLLYTLYAFTIIRYVFYLVLTFLFEREAMGLEMFICLTSVPVAYVSNTILGKFVGPKLSLIFESGMVMDWGIFMFCTAVILGVFGFSKLINWLEVSGRLKYGKEEVKEVKEEMYYKLPLTNNF